MPRPKVENRLMEIQDGIKEIRDFIRKMNPSACNSDSKSNGDED